MLKNIIKARNWKIVDTAMIDGRSFMLRFPENIALCAAEHIHGRVKTVIGKNKAGIYFYKTCEDRLVAVDVTKIDLIKVHTIAA